MSSDRYPDEVNDLHDALGAIPDLREVSSSIQSLQGLEASELGLADFAALPHGALRRTSGGLEGEVLVQVEFQILPTDAGLKGLEFIAWFVRDQARGGESVQLRPFALPPVAGSTVQLGSTLRFQVDLFVVSESGDLQPILSRISGLTRDLRTALALYGAALR